jgi:signal transduction histidine kinase/ActR/RegA family two-component response regulator/HAMP domain-containing protein
MNSFSSLRFRLVGTVFLAILPALLLLYIIETYWPRTEHAQNLPDQGAEVEPHSRIPWSEFIVGLVALGAAWFGGERFILRQVRAVCGAAKQLAMGDLSIRTGLAHEKGELGELARAFDSMVMALEQRVKERERVEKALLDKNFQQTVVSSLGQFAFVSDEFPALLNQTVMLVSQTLGVQYCCILELRQDERSFLLKAGVGWKPGYVGVTQVAADPSTQYGFTLTAGEPVVVQDLATDRRFAMSPLLTDHGAVSGVTVLISGHGRAYGVLGVHTTQQRRFNEDEVHFLLAVATILAMGVERNRTETQLQKQSSFAQLNPTPAMELRSDATITYFNDAASNLVLEIGRLHPREILPENVAEVVEDCLENGRPQRLETTANGRTLSWSFHPVVLSNVVHCYVEDITQRLNLEAQLRQSQKMESIGQLAAGVAHDFNNMLTIIQGHSGILLARPNLPADLQDSAQAIYFGAERAASLTRQLLMFSRKNVIQPRQLDLREVVGNMSKMLQRLLGETVRLEFRPPEELPLIQADSGMLEQVVMNLAVNARDAMPKGGVLMISVTPVLIERAYVQTHPQARLGRFVRLRAHDTGTGMDARTKARIFEPFFTTKEVGKGTGLGLATVYGIVKQHEGWVDVESEPGVGTIFDVFLPALTENAPRPVEPKKVERSMEGGKETILVVEDEDVLRDLAKMILAGCGYQIIEARSGAEALRVWETHAEKVDLLLTDMVMPEGMSGMDLATRLLAAKPGLRIIFASGYSMDDLDTSFVHKGHASFLQKPYTHVTLTKAVRACLDA